jgi:hypothetical protein
VLVVIDPIVRIARIKEEKAYAEVYAALGPLIDIARETGTHILLLHHSGKLLKADATDSPLGSTAFGGVVATLIALKRLENKTRTIQTVQRTGTELSETVLLFDEETKVLTKGGTREQVDIDALKQPILDYLIGSEEPRTEAEIDEAVEGSRSARKKALRLLVGEGKVTRSGAGKRNDPFKYTFAFVSGISGFSYIQNTRIPETKAKTDDGSQSNEDNEYNSGSDFAYSGFAQVEKNEESKTESETSFYEEKANDKSEGIANSIKCIYCGEVQPSRLVYSRHLKSCPKRPD